MGTVYRPGAKPDCARLAELINIASDGVVKYLFHDLIPGMTPVEVVAYNLENDKYPHSYKSTIVALDGDKIVGAVLSYPSDYHRITDEMRSFLPKERLEHFSDFYKARVENSWLIDALCVTASHRKRGIGSKLIALTKKIAIDKNFNQLSLIVFADNTLAIPVYERAGFKVVQRVKISGNRFIKHEDGCLLMRCEIKI